MIAQLYSLPSWVISGDDKPDLQLFNSWQSQNNALPFNVQTVQYPTLDKILIQGQWQQTDLLAYNYILWNGRYYVITNIQYVSVENGVVKIEGKIDVYLSFMINYFDETLLTNATTQVYFKQKHMNRFWYLNDNPSTPYIYYSKQFYLLNTFPQLANVGSKKLKSVIYPQTDYYVPWTTDFANTSAKCQGFYNQTVYPTTTEVYPVICWKMGVGENDINAHGSYPFPFGLSQLGGWDFNLSWWELLKYVSNDYYTDVIMFPLPLTCYYNVPALNPKVTIATVTDVIGIQEANNITRQYTNGWKPDNDFCIAGGTNRLTAFANVKPAQWNGDYSNVEPMLLNWYDINVRMYGQDMTVDLTAFDGYKVNPNGLLDNATVQSFFLSHVITCSVPHFTCSNVSLVSWLNFVATTSNLDSNFTCWNYNNFNDTIFMVDMKCTVPSVSNNWSNYLAQHNNQYDMGLNIAGLMAQNAQQEITIAQNRAGGDEASLLNPFGDVFKFVSGNYTSSIASAINEQIVSQSIAPNDYAIANDRATYMSTGMKKDYSRVSNLRNASITAVNTLFDSNFVNVYEYPVAYEQLVVINYCALYGYLLERWDNWGNWYNRTLCNYVKCTNWAKAMLTGLNAYYFQACEDLMEHGIRVWTQASNQGYAGINYNRVLYNEGEYTNVEVNENNDEINWLILGYNA